MDQFVKTRMMGDVNYWSKRREEVLTFAEIMIYSEPKLILLRLADYYQGLIDSAERTLKDIE